MKYDISKEFGIYRFIKPPFNKATFYLAKPILSCFRKGINNEIISTQKIKIPTRDNKEINCYIIKPKNISSPLPVIFYFHGGAFVYGGAPYHFKHAVTYAKESKGMVVYVDYRLAFNTPYETSLNDCIDAYKHILNNHKSLGVDSNKICVAGDSAGGYLATTLTIKAKEQNFTLPNHLMLIYPVLSQSLVTHSKTTFTDTPLWNGKLNKKMWKTYSKGNEVISFDKLNNLSFFPSTYIETAEFDPLKDEGINFACLLKNSKVSVTLNQTKKTMHGFDIVTKSAITKEAINTRVQFLKTAFHE